MRRALLCLCLTALAACASGVPDSNPDLSPVPVDTGRGVGFGSYDAYEQARIARERQLNTGVAVQPVISSEELAAAGLPVAASPAATSVPATGGPLPNTGPASAAQVPVVGTVPAPAPVASGPVAGPAPAVSPAAPITGAPVPAASPGGNAGISDEQSFEAVSSRETIESDAERLARQAAAYQVVPPTAAPTRSGQEGPNIVQYALSTTNSVGQPLYRRGGFGSGEGRAARNCAKYASPDLAQIAFLERGGPQADRLGLDPDGDGFACGWNPAPFRAARG